ncbi:probable RNA helicase SDE3 [Amborella trichopoda]|uniref:RNA helicase n=1 Tax=Amborella trichopoda TaxID=13333 RepID=W1P3P5_AMBTC|nr:probable RNA helicase SDE3 [Amborella trichopoda]XP_020519858.1 probable RNA helicase SDE3 [Amborella trichopoda]XP_020519859.1 probable RNA helicase SDE3 [Amborella trichopoda]ERN01585.1 hypothetical protein AMTR_s00002p00272090 [Amborella trichopoda]|eukprot:XP_006839016.1 probable RNA helicase SDE3 [Amborella trichopoda]
MGSVDDDCDSVSVIGAQPDVGFLDFEDDETIVGVDWRYEGPVTISNPFALVHGKPPSVLIGETAVDIITVQNMTAEPLDLWGVKIYSCNPAGSFSLSTTEPPSTDADEETLSYFLETMALEDRVLDPGQVFKIWLSCKAKEIGLHNCVIHFDVGDDRVERIAFVLAEDNVSQLLTSRKPYLRENRKKSFGTDKFVAGSRPQSTAPRYRFPLPKFLIPLFVREMAKNKQVPEVLMEGLTPENYMYYFTALLNLEELHMEEEMRNHDMYNVMMMRRGPFLALEVPGLAEKRPSLVCGDYICAKLSNDFQDDGQPYQGYIHRVEADQVFLKFAKEFHQYHRDTYKYDVSFSYNRVNMRRLYQAVMAAQELGLELLFPSSPSQRRLTRAPPITPLNQGLNEEQISAVEMILRCRGSPPYVIHGPPGTGKTVTIVEAISQLYTIRNNSRILVCASSNSAADHVLDKLIPHVKENQIFRLNASSRPFEEVKQDIIQYCYFDDMVFQCPPLIALSRYKIIVSTYMSTACLYAEGIRRGHFSHIFLDEAGQASEPETMIPISNLCNRETVVVLAGDSMQLGPVVYSKVAETYNLGTSFLERLSYCEPYANGDSSFVIKLLRNYRCHPAILELPSNLFYSGDLIACKEKESDLALYEWEELPNKEFPVVFFGIQGCDEREGTNPSWFNRIEASKVVEIIRKLTEDAEVGADDIGVITPYRQQVSKLRLALESMDLGGIKVGSVEQFQGQERQVIIISTVRSTVKYDDFDKRHCLGFLSNPRRFNVAITRAISLLIIIGNPHIVCKDKHWAKLLKHCTDNNSYEGCPLPQLHEPEEYAEEDIHQETFHDEGNPWPDTSNEQGWDNHSTFNKVEELPPPVTDEAEWSDGWR